MATPEQVVTATRRALERRKTPPSIVAGLGNRISTFASTLTPRRVTLAVSGRILKASFPSSTTLPAANRT